MPRILIVEDDAQTAELMKFVLLPRGYEVEHMMEGTHAVSRAKVFQPDLIILDVMLPGLDGYSIQAKLLEEEQTQSTPVIVMTSKSNMEEVFRTASNVVDFIPKPFVVKEFLEKVKAALKK